MCGGGLNRRPRDASGTSARRRDDDDAGGRRSAVVRGRIETREDLDREDVGGRDLLEHLEIVERHVIEDHARSEEHTSELQSRSDLVCRLLLAKKKIELMMTNDNVFLHVRRR